MRRGLAFAVTATALLTMPAAASGQTFCSGTLPPDEPTPVQTTSKLRFSIYPGGSAGSVLPVPPSSQPEDQGKIFSALDRLRPANGPLAVHLYIDFTDDPQANSESLDVAEGQIRLYGDAGYEVELVVRFRSDAGDAAGYAEFLRQAVRRLAPLPGFKGLQVANEANFTAAPDAADGAYPNVRQALVAGVIAADDEADQLGRPLEVGFNWFYRTAPGAEEEFWTELGTIGGDPFRDALDWVGLDAYPGTFFPPGADSSNGRGAMINALDVLRDCFMPLAGIGDAVAIHVTENGYPTDLGTRTPERQRQVLETMVRAVHEFRANFNVTSYNWFALRDGDSSSPDFQQHYGLLNDDYSEKPAFGAYCALIAELSGDAGGCAASPAGRCTAIRIGTAGADLIEGTAGGDRLRGLAGRDRLFGGPGDDCAHGGKGGDRISGGDGRDHLEGGWGRDRIKPGPGADFVAAGAKRDRIASRDGERDEITCGKGVDRVKADQLDLIVAGCERVRRR